MMNVEMYISAGKETLSKFTAIHHEAITAMYIAGMDIDWSMEMAWAAIDGIRGYSAEVDKVIAEKTANWSAR